MIEFYRPAEQDRAGLDLTVSKLANNLNHPFSYAEQNREEEKKDKASGLVKLWYWNAQPLPHNPSHTD